MVLEVHAGRARLGVRHAMDVHEAAARDDVFDVRAAVARGQVAQDGDLALGARGKIRVASLGRHGHEASIHGVQQSLAQAGAGGNQRDTASWPRRACLKHVHFRGLQRRHGPGHRLQSR